MATSTKKATAANYSDEALKTLEAGYTGTNNKAEVAALAAKLGKTVPSVRAKLAGMGLYKKEEAAKGASTRTKKVDTVESLSKFVPNLTPADCEGLEKATAAPLEKILAALTNAAKRETESDPES